MSKPKKKIMIVIEDTGGYGGNGFNVYLTGDTQRLDGKTPNEELTAAEFWGAKLMQICIGTLHSAGVVKNVKEPQENQ